METTKVRLRRNFSPLTAATSMVCHTGSSSPFTQVYDAETSSYEPDRGGTSSGVGSPCLVRPIIELNADDGSMTNARGNEFLSTSSMKWYVNGVDITTIQAWQDGYAISTVAGPMRGTLTVYRNVPIGERCELTFEGVINDPRTNQNIPVTAGPVVLRTTDKSKDQWSMSICVDPSLEYDPIRDRLLLYNYMVAHGEVTAAPATEQAADDDSSYRQHVPIEVRRGVTLQNSGYTLELYRVNSSTGALTQISTSDLNEVISMSLSELVVDLRLIEKEEYVLIAKHGTTEVARQSFGMKRHNGDYTLTPVNAAGVAPSDIIRRDVLQGRYDGNTLDHPACAIRILWKTKASGSNTTITQNEGETTEYNLGKAGLGQDYATAEIDQWVESEVKSKYAIAKESTTDGGKVYCDENNVPFIFN